MVKRQSNWKYYGIGKHYRTIKLTHKHEGTIYVFKFCITWKAVYVPATVSSKCCTEEHDLGAVVHRNFTTPKRHYIKPSMYVLINSDNLSLQDKNILASTLSFKR